MNSLLIKNEHKYTGKDLEIEILKLFDNLDYSLDGWIIKSENYQALNTILPKFKEKAQTIYIDPPFNTGEDFSYVDRFQDSSWSSLVNDRIMKSLEFLQKTGCCFFHLNENVKYYGKILLNNLKFDSGVMARYRCKIHLSCPSGLIMA